MLKKITFKEVYFIVYDIVILIVMVPIISVRVSRVYLRMNRNPNFSRCAIPFTFEYMDRI